MTPEAKVKAKVKAILIAHGVYHFYPIAGVIGKSGVPDVICCCGGVFLAIECKAGKGKVTPLQAVHIRDIRAAGGLAIVVNETNVGQLDEFTASISTIKKTQFARIVQALTALFPSAH